MHTHSTEFEALSALIARVNSSLAMDEVLDQATEVCTSLTGCAGALVYLWDAEQERLVIRGASEGYRHWIDVFSLAPGEGLTGWTALNRRPGIITDDPLSDPRYKLVPELEDTRFQSMLTVPVVGREEQLLGVLTLHTTAPHEFSGADVQLMETVASLVAGAVENARLHEQALRTMRVFRSLADIGRSITSRTPETLQRLALTALELVGATLVVVLRLDEARGRLSVETWVGGGSTPISDDSLPLDRHFARLLDAGAASVQVTDDEALVRGLGLRAPVRSLFSAPLVHDGKAVGILCCYTRERRVLGDDNLALLATIANHVAIALEEDRLSATADERTKVRDLIDALRAGDRDGRPLADALGIDLGSRHAVVLVEALGDTDAPWPAVLERLPNLVPGAVADLRPRTLWALVPLAEPDWSDGLEAALGELVPEGAVAGYSDAVQAPDDYPRAFREARMACAVAHTSSTARRVQSYPALGAQRYLWTISRERDPDPVERAVGRLVELDGERGSQLFRTLETYLDRRGNARETAAALYVHRNTLRQRLRRIAAIIELDPTDPANWFDLMLAVRLHRFRELAPTA